MGNSPGMTIDDLMRAPDHPDLLTQHLVKMGYLNPPVPREPISLSRPNVPSPMMTETQPHQDSSMLANPYGTNYSAVKHAAETGPRIADFTPPDISTTPKAPGMMSTVKPMQPVRPTEQQSIEAGMAQTGRNAHDEGQAQFHELRPTIDTSAAGTPQFYRQELQQQEFDKAHPWGAPISSHPGLLGKIGHIAAKVGNIAGNIVAPGTMANIPGTDLYKQEQERETERNLLASEGMESLGREREAQAKEAEARAAKIGRPDQPDLLQDAAGNLVGWKDADGSLHSLDEETTPPAIKKIAEEWEGKAGAKPVRENLEQGLAGAVQDAIAAGQDPKTNKAVIAWGEALQTYKPTKGTDVKTAEDLKNRIAQAVEKGDAAEVKRLQDELLAIDPEGMARLMEARARQREVSDRANETRSDKSYQYNKSELEKKATPIDQLLLRMGRVEESLDQGTPVADALIAPELLSIMAGGQGSGLRMNEAEIARVVHGQSHWQDLQAAVNRWKLDPKTANSITSEQRKMIRDLAMAVKRKLVAKNDAINRARQGLLATDDPKEHRALIVGVEKMLNDIDAGREVTQEPPAGKTTVYDPQGTPHYVNSDKVDKFLKDPKYKGWTRNAPAGR